MKSIMELLKEAPVVDYDPSKGITMDELNEWAVKLIEMKPSTPEYILSKWEAENLPLWQLNWLGENYRVLCSLEVSNIVKERAKTQP